MADIKEVIDMMVADGSPEAEIIALIDRYNKDKQAEKTTGLPEIEPSVQDRTAPPGVVVPEVIGEAPELTMEDFEMTDEERVEFDRKAEEQRLKGIAGKESYLV